MFRRVALLAVVPALMLAAPVRAADEAKEIIEKAIKAHGGQEGLTKYKATQSKNKGKIDLPGVGEVDFTQETSAMLPDKVRESMELSIAGQKVSVLTLINGDKMVIEVNGKEIDVPAAAKDAIKDLGYMLKVGRLASLTTEKGFELSLIGGDKVEGKAVVGVRVSSKGHKDISLYFDKKTNLLAKLEHRTADATTGNEISEERIVTEYTKNKDGMPIPKTVLVKRDGKKFLEAEVLEVTYLEKLDDSEFKK